MADGFYTNDIDKSYQIYCKFLGKKITISKTIKLNTKLKKYISWIYISSDNA